MGGVGENGCAGICDGCKLRVQETAETVDATALNAHGVSIEDGYA